MSTHLTRDRLDAWLSGALSEADRAVLLAHLDGCESCASLLDEDALARLLAAEEAPPAQPPPMRLPASAPTTAGSRPGRSLLAHAGLLLAAAALALGVLSRSPTDHPDLLVEKGTPTAVTPTVRLTVATTLAGGAAGAGRAGAGGEARETKLRAGDRVGHDAVLVAQIDTDAPGARYLFAVDGDGVRHKLLPAAGQPAPVEPPGARPAAWDGAWIALALDDVAGPVTLVALASAAPLAPPASSREPEVTLDAAIASWPVKLDGVGYDAVQLEVGP